MTGTERLTAEFEFIRWIRSRMAAHPRVPIGIGDDAAALHTTPGRALLVTTDMIIEGVHFDLHSTTLRQVGRKAMAVNLSDIAAMAGVPLAAVASVGLPASLSRRDAEELMCGLDELATEFSVALVGGDTNRSPNGLIVAVTLLGETTERGPVRRSGAQPGDAIMVTGSLGGSIAGRHLAFTPRVREALALAEQVSIHAMIDVSDGLAADLSHILDESGCGGRVRAASIPISDVARHMSGSVAPLHRALHDGEDFELLFTVSPADAEQILINPPARLAVSRIGQIVSEPGLVLETFNGERVALEPKGYDHFHY